MNDIRKEMSVFLERQTVRKRRDWTRKVVRFQRGLFSAALVLAGIAVLYGIYWLTFLSPIFSINRIVVEGEWKHLDKDMIAGLTCISQGDNLFFTNVNNIREKVKANEWVKSVAVHRKLPDTVWLYVEEEVPVAVCVVKGELYYVNSETDAFKLTSGGDDRNYPLFTGVCDGEDKEVMKSKLTEMIELVKGFETSTLGEKLGVSEINYDELKGFSIITRREPMQIVLGQNNALEMLKKIDEMSKDILNRGRIQYILANEKKRVVVKFKEFINKIENT